VAAALLPAAALWPLDATWRRSMTSGRPPWMGRPPLPGLRPARCLQGGRRHRASSARRLGGQQRSNAGEGGKARVFDCAIGVQSVLSSTHAHPTCASSPRTSRALLGNRSGPSPPHEMPMVTTALRHFLLPGNGRGNRNIHQVARTHKSHLWDFHRRVNSRKGTKCKSTHLVRGLNCVVRCYCCWSESAYPQHPKMINESYSIILVTLKRNCSHL